MSAPIVAASTQDHSDPAVTSLTTTAIDAPANSLLLAAVARDGSSIAMPTITNSGPALDWTQLLSVANGQADWANGSLSVWLASTTPAHDALTVTATYGTSNQMSVDLRAVVGATVMGPIGSRQRGSTSSQATLTTPGLVVERPDSLFYCAVGGLRDVGTLPYGNPTAPELSGVLVSNMSNEHFSLVGTIPVGEGGTSVSASVNSPSNLSSSHWNWIVLEIASVTSIGRRTGGFLQLL